MIIKQIYKIEIKYVNGFIWKTKLPYLEKKDHNKGYQRFHMKISINLKFFNQNKYIPVNLKIINENLN